MKTKNKSGKSSYFTAVDRRQFLKTMSATAATIAAMRLTFPAGAYAQGAGPEVKGCRLGYIALTDAAPLIIAKEKGLFDKYGVPDVSVEKQASWGATRDNMTLGGERGGIDGAHILRPKPHLYTLGTVIQNNQPLPTYNLINLSENCQGISVANIYKDTHATLDSSPLKEFFAKRKAEGKEITAAMTFPGGTHDLWLRYWLAAGGIKPDVDVSVIVVPPPQMVANMKVGNMDCFCVGEPWNEQLANQKIGYSALTTGELWKNHPEKTLGMRADFVDKNPRATLAIMAAVIEAQIWCDKLENKDEMAKIISKRQWFNVPVKDIIGRIKGVFNYGNGVTKEAPELAMRFWGKNGEVSYPWKSLDSWFITENKRWGYIQSNVDTNDLIDKTNRSDLWQEAAKMVGLNNLPNGYSRGIETFFDGKIFDHTNPQAYLDSLAIKTMV